MPSKMATAGETPLDVASLLTGPRDGASPEQMAAVSGAGEQRSKLEWDGIPESVRQHGALSAMESNLRRQDYAGPESCRECHPKNYDNWMHHSHRLMNAMATDEMVRGDFSGKSTMSYLGGTVHFWKEKDDRFMKFERGGVSRTYRIRRTIGSRFTQYYIGLLVDGPEPPDHPARKVDHVLAVGWWIDHREWIPVVHIDREGPDGTRWDPFAKVADVPYDTSCSACHTTPPMGDWLLNPTGIMRMGFFTPVPVFFDVKSYLTETHPEYRHFWSGGQPPPATDKIELLREIRDQSAVDKTVSLGITCEACHNGCKEHVRASDKNKSAVLPQFFPVGNTFVAESDAPGPLYSRNPRSINFICSRCHSGGRPCFASGAATWNSVEYSDGEAGYCYIRKKGSHPDQNILSCNICHDPHEPIGTTWKKTPDEDDATCLKCHARYQPEHERFRHTHHKAGTEGARCLNCHMPRMNEGLNAVVRSHAVTNPSWPSMIEANQPNACNLCHLDKSIDWTISWLSRWYKIDRYNSYDAGKLAKNYPDLNGPVGLGWLKSPHESTRLVAVSALAREKAVWALPQMIGMLDDPYLLNRLFTRMGLEDWFGVRLEDYGYRYYETPEERQQPVESVRAALLKKGVRD
jgi:hypothetical protein